MKIKKMQKISDLRAEIRKMIQFGQFDFLEFFQIFLKKNGRAILFGKVLKIVFEKTVIYFGDKCAGRIKPQLF